MTRNNICVVVAIIVGLLGGMRVAEADAADALLASIGQFQLDNGESKTVQRSAAVKAYRVCMDEGYKAVPLQVTHDGKVTVVAPGECQLIEANKIKLASAAPLARGMTLIGSFEAPSKSKHYSTDVSVAQAARNE